MAMTQKGPVLLIGNPQSSSIQTLYQLLTTDGVTTARADDYDSVCHQLNQLRFDLMIFDASPKTGSELMMLAKRLKKFKSAISQDYCAKFFIAEKKLSSFFEQYIGNSIDGVIYKPMNEKTLQSIFEGAEAIQHIKLLLSKKSDIDHADKLH